MKKGIFFKRVIFVIFLNCKSKKIGLGICEDICYSKKNTRNLVKNYSDKHLKKSYRTQARFYFKPFLLSLFPRKNKT